VVATVSALKPASAPIPRTRLIGREAEITTARPLLLDEAVPLLTLTGAGGVGKTRLALEVAQDVAASFADGVVWVDLAPIVNPALVPATLAAALEFVPPPDRPVATELVRHLRTRQVLLLLDNCEHLLAAVADLVVPLLSFCPALQVLATSRAPLRIRGEYALSVAPLNVPRAGNRARESIAGYPAVRLFVERARAANAAAVAGDDALPMVAEICRNVDGLPLAIELAAARLRVLPLAALRDRLHQRLPLLEDSPRDAPARQRTMRDTIAWSYDLLTPPEQSIFRGLAVFAGGFNLEAAQAVARGDTPLPVFSNLERLAEHHLINPAPGTRELRFSMFETIREFGLERLAESGVEEETRRRHAAFYLRLVNELDASWAPFMPNAQQILDRLEVEYPNLHAALAWLRDSGDVAQLLELAGKLHFFWQLGHIREGREWLEWGLGRDADVPHRARAAGQISLAGILSEQGEFARAVELCDESIQLFQEADDAIGVAHACECAVVSAFQFGQLERASSCIDQVLVALTKVGTLPWVTGLATHLTYQRGIVAILGGHLATAEGLFTESVEAQRALAQETGVAHPYACWPLKWLGTIDCIMGRHALGLSRLQAALDHAWRFQEQHCVVALLMNVARVLVTAGRWQESAQLFGAAEAWCERCGYHFWEDQWPWERAFGLPEPWQQGDEPFGDYEWMRAASVAYRSKPLPPLPDPVAAAEFWATGRCLPIEDAVTRALAVDLTAPPAPGEARVPASLLVAAPSLSPREHEVLTLLCQRLTDPQIAERLFLSPRTVESHVASLLRKLDVTNRRDAAAAAVQLGLV
jgi:predicted ATPase/DNA-binding CsgD family transcriptional regulator